MKQVVLLSAIVMIALVPRAHAGVTEAARTFDEGNRHYEVGNYSAAIASYDAALGEGYASAALFYNLGNAYYRIDELGEAIRAYERARLLAPGDPDILHNLEIARERTVDQFSRLPVPFWRQAWLEVVRSVGAWGLFAAGIVLWLSAAAVFVGRTFADWRSPWSRRVLTATVLVGVVLLSASFAASLESQWNRRGVVTAEQTDLYEQPSEPSSQRMTIHEGVIVDVLDQRADWLLVRLPNGTDGWTPSEVVGMINL